MTITAMDILTRCRAAERELRLLGEKVARCRDASQRMTSTLDGVGSLGTGESDRLAAIIGEIDDLERKRASRQREYTAELAAAMKLVDTLPSVECIILSRFYVRRQPLKAIALELGYSYGYVRSCKGEGCNRLKQVPEGVILALLPPWYINDDEKRQR